MGNTNLSITVCLLRLLTLTNMYTPTHISILAHTCLPMVITVISYKILTNTNMYSTMYKCLLSRTKLCTPINKYCIDVYNFVNDNKWNNLQNTDKCKVIFDNIQMFIANNKLVYANT